jgi:hypothetical protein
MEPTSAESQQQHAECVEAVRQFQREEWALREALDQAAPRNGKKPLTGSASTPPAATVWDLLDFCERLMATARDLAEEGEWHLAECVANRVELLSRRPASARHRGTDEDWLCLALPPRSAHDASKLEVGRRKIHIQSLQHAALTCRQQGKLRDARLAMLEALDEVQHVTPQMLLNYMSILGAIGDDVADESILVASDAVDVLRADLAALLAPDAINVAVHGSRAQRRQYEERRETVSAMLVTAMAQQLRAVATKLSQASPMMTRGHRSNDPPQASRWLSRQGQGTSAQVVRVYMAHRLCLDLQECQRLFQQELCGNDVEGLDSHAQQLADTIHELIDDFSLWLATNSNAGEASMDLSARWKYQIRRARQFAVLHPVYQGRRCRALGAMYAAAPYAASPMLLLAAAADQSKSAQSSRQQSTEHPQTAKAPPVAAPAAPVDEPLVSVRDADESSLLLGSGETSRTASAPHTDASDAGGPSPRPLPDKVARYLRASSAPRHDGEATATTSRGTPASAPTAKPQGASRRRQPASQPKQRDPSPSPTPKAPPATESTAQPRTPVHSVPRLTGAAHEDPEASAFHRLSAFKRSDGRAAPASSSARHVTTSTSSRPTPSQPGVPVKSGGNARGTPMRAVSPGLACGEPISPPPALKPLSGPGARPRERGVEQKAGADDAPQDPPLLPAHSEPLPRPAAAGIREESHHHVTPSRFDPDDRKPFSSQLDGSPPRRARPEPSPGARALSGPHYPSVNASSSAAPSLVAPGQGPRGGAASGARIPAHRPVGRVEPLFATLRPSRASDDRPKQHLRSEDDETPAQPAAEEPGSSKAEPAAEDGREGTPTQDTPVDDAAEPASGSGVEAAPTNTNEPKSKSPDPTPPAA